MTTTSKSDSHGQDSVPDLPGTKGHGHGSVRFQVDGRHFTSREADVTAAHVLQLAGLDPTLYDLAPVVHHSPTTVYQDQDVVHLRNGDRFVSVRQTAQVA